MNASIKGLLCAIAVSAILCGCGKDESNKSSAAAAAATPQIAAKNMTEAILKGDKGLFEACFVGTPEQIKALGSAYEYSRAGIKFRDALIKAYGKEGWARFQDREAAGGASASINVPDETKLALIANAKCEINGDSATLTVEGEQPVALKKSNGSWRIDAGALLPPNAEPAKFGEMMASMASLLTKYQKAIGKPGIKPEDINYELGRAMGKLMMGISTDAPHRFDIDKL